MKAVIDTNVYISALLWSGTPYIVVQKAINRDFDICCSEELLHELQEKLEKKFKFGKEESREYAQLIRRIAEILTPVKIEKAVLQDPKDIKVLEIARTARADIIVSGDKHLLSLKEFEGIPIINCKEFLRKKLA